MSNAQWPGSPKVVDNAGFVLKVRLEAHHKR